METLKPGDLYRFKLGGDPQISHDGSKVAFTISQADKKSDSNVSSIWIVPVGDGKPSRLTRSGKDRMPRWSPDGRRLAFVSDRSGRPQIWIYEIDGGEPWILSTRESVRTAPSWSPCGNYIVFGARDFTKPENWEPYPGAPEWDRGRALDQKDRDLYGKGAGKGEGNSAAMSGGNGVEKKVSDIKVITRFRYRFDGVGYLGDVRNHLFIVRVPETAPESGEFKANSRRLTSGDFDHEGTSFSPDGRFIAVSALRQDDADYSQKQDIWLVEVATGRMIKFLDSAGPLGNIEWSPGGSRLAFVGNDRSYGGSTSPNLWIVPVAPFLERLSERGGLSVPPPLTLGNAINVTSVLDRPVGNPVSSDVRLAPSGPPYRWEGENALVFMACDRGATGLYCASISEENGKPSVTISTVWHDAGKTLACFSKAGETTVVQVGSPVEPDDLYLLKESSCGFCLDRLTDLNPWLKQRGIGSFERFTYKGDKGWDIDGWMLYPQGYEQGKKYPTVLFIHGGPHGVYGSAFMLQCQMFAARGYAVVYTNPRGSQSYGQEFAYACVGDWGGGDFLDIMAGVAWMIQKGIADPKRLFITGWSYGGYMTSWAITQTNRFRAAVAGAVVSDRYSMYGTSDIPFFSEHHCGGLPWNARDEYLDRSAIAHVSKVETPVLFIHGEGDLRCPISQSEEYYLSLRRLGKTAVFVRYPGEYHGFTKPSHKFDRFERMIAWFNYYQSN